MITRIWQARTSPEKQAAYLQQVQAIVIPHLQGCEGYLGAQFLCRHTDRIVEIMVLTHWASREALNGFADEGSKIYLPDEIAATLEGYDQQSRHFELMLEDSC